MLLRDKTKKFQTGGALNQAKNEYAPIDIRWQKFDLSSYNAPGSGSGTGASRTSGSNTSGTTSKGGIPSDIKYVDTQLTNARERMKTGLSGPNSEAYRDSAEFNVDAEEVNKWSEIKATMLKPNGDNFKAIRTKLSKSTADDYAMSGGKALVKDLEDGELKIIDSVDIATARTRDGDKTVARYLTATVGDALSLRFSDERFSGFSEEGAELDVILSNVLDSDAIDNEMDKLFKAAGKVVDDNFITNTGASTSVSDLLANLETASVGTNSNETTLNQAVGLFKGNMNQAQLESLTNKMTVQFSKDYANEKIGEAEASSIINNRVNASIAKRALIFLKQTGAKSTAGQADKDFNKKSITTNEIYFGTMVPEGTVSIGTGYSDVEDLVDKFEMMVNIPASTVNASEAFDKEAETNYIVAASPLIKKLAEGNLRDNLFLADEDSTPVASLNGGTGLESTMTNVANGVNIQILMGMPYTEDANKRKRIAWDKMEDAVRWGRTYKELATAREAKLGVAHLSAEQKREIIAATIEETGLDFSDDQPVKIGTIAMIPILFNDRSSIDEPGTVDDIFSSDISSQESNLINAITKWHTREDDKKTFAFTVLKTGLAQMQPGYYGDTFSMSKPIFISDIVNNAKHNQNSSYDWQPIINAATIRSTEQ